MSVQMLSLAIPGRPVAWARAGSSGAKRFTPPKQSAYMAVVATIARAAMARAGYKPFEGPVEVVYRATFAGPKKKPNATGWRVAAPDIDNLAKGALDSLSAIVFTDDAQVVSLSAQKRFGHPVGAVITITSLAGEGTADAAA